MDSPYSKSSSSRIRSRASSNFPIISHLDNTSIKKRNSYKSSRPRSISSLDTEQSHRLLPDQLRTQLLIDPEPLDKAIWDPSQATESAQFFSSPHSQSITNPNSIPGHHSPDLANNVDNKTIISTVSSEDAVRSLPASTLASMPSLGYLPPPQYGNMSFHDPSFNQAYQNLDSQHHHAQSNNLHSVYSQEFSAQPLYTPSGLSMNAPYSAPSLEPSMTHISDPTSSLNRGTSPFQQPVYDGVNFSSQQISSSRSISHSPMSSQPNSIPVGSISPHQTNGLQRSPHFFESNLYSNSFSAPAVEPPQQLYQGPQRFSYPPPQSLGSSGSARHSLPTRTESESHVRVINPKPKPQCWDHGCNGREFSTFSNLLRHQREKSGTAAKSYCPKCGAEFTRTTARNGHLAHEKCSKQRRTSTESK